MTYVQLGVHSFLFSNLCSGIVGTGVARPADMLDFEISGFHCGECYVITVLWDVTQLTIYLGQTSVLDDNDDFNFRGAENS